MGRYAGGSTDHQPLKWKFHTRERGDGEEMNDLVFVPVSQIYKRQLRVKCVCPSLAVPWMSTIHNSVHVRIHWAEHLYIYMLKCGCLYFVLHAKVEAK